MKKRKMWKLTHIKFGDEYHMTDEELKKVRKFSRLKNYKVERTFILR